MSTRTRSQRKAQIDRMTRDIGRNLATKTVLFHSTLAAHLGLSGTDLKCLDLIRNAHTPLTARDLVAQTGLTGGAITGVVDRLEDEGFVRRVRDTKDRRRWELHAVEATRETVLDLFGHLRDSISDLCQDYSDAELAVIESFLIQLGDALDHAGEELRAAKGSSTHVVDA